jgi:hypothetical protein
MLNPDEYIWIDTQNQGLQKTSDQLDPILAFQLIRNVARIFKPWLMKTTL